ncbi:LysR family substrate-binding domain-containing protein [Microbacterium oleivorans]|uniref:LysR family substrate-binding domain-containing protein n=1 Tax=Microbacterium oleivorans TaxID=273677 RepID=UPI003563574A
MDVWKTRMPRTPLELVPIEVAQQRDALVDGTVDAAIVRMPVERDGLSVIALYDEVPVAVCAADSALTAVDELTLADLDGEVVIVPRDDVLQLDVPGSVAPSFPPVASTADAIATVAAGVGIAIVPMSLARLHQRKDVHYRPIVDAPVSGVALAWRTEATTPSVNAFIGIVRGRTANSSR